jgi:hypothetical protein
MPYDPYAPQQRQQPQSGYGLDFSPFNGLEDIAKQRRQREMQDPQSGTVRDQSGQGWDATWQRAQQPNALWGPASNAIGGAMNFAGGLLGSAWNWGGNALGRGSPENSDGNAPRKFLGIGW